MDRQVALTAMALRTATLGVAAFAQPEVDGIAGLDGFPDRPAPAGHK